MSATVIGSILQEEFNKAAARDFKWWVRLQIRKQRSFKSAEKRFRRFRRRHLLIELNEYTYTYIKRPQRRRLRVGIVGNGDAKPGDMVCRKSGKRVLVMNSLAAGLAEWLGLTIIRRSMK